MDTAAGIVRDARQRSGLTQSELGARAGVVQSVISAYESGTREPGLGILNKLVDAAGFVLEIDLRPAPQHSVLQKLVHRNRLELGRVLQSLGASNIRLFGSVARGDDDTGSDVDLMVDVTDRVGLFALGQMRTEAERILGVAVDIVPSNSLKPELIATVLDEAIAL